MRRSAVALLLAVSACSGGGTTTVARSTPTPSPTASPTPSPTPSATPSATPSPTPSATAVRTSPAPARTSAPPRRTAPAVATCPGLRSGTQQVLLVVSSGSRATVRACERTASGYRSVLGVMHGHVGRAGVAPVGAKREGDLRTPGGTFTLGQGFGQVGDPGVRFPWRVTTARDVWVDDSGSALYNTWQQKPANGRWDSAEDLDVAPYRYAQVIDYNTARVPGRGSAIFLHVDRGRGTLGCVSLPVSDLLRVLRWERAGATITIR